MNILLLGLVSIIGGAIVFGLSGLYSARMNIKGLFYVGLSQIVIFIVELMLLNKSGISFGLSVIAFVFIVFISPIALINWLIAKDGMNSLVNYAMLARYSLRMRQISLLSTILIPVVVLFIHDFGFIWPLLFRVEIYWLYVYSDFVRLIVTMVFLVPMATVMTVGFRNKTHGLQFISDYEMDSSVWSVLNKFKFLGIGSGSLRLLFAVVCYVLLCVIYYK